MFTGLLKYKATNTQFFNFNKDIDLTKMKTHTKKVFSFNAVTNKTFYDFSSVSDSSFYKKKKQVLKDLSDLFPDYQIIICIKNIEAWNKETASMFRFKASKDEQNKNIFVKIQTHYSTEKRSDNSENSEEEDIAEYEDDLLSE